MLYVEKIDKYIDVQWSANKPKNSFPTFIVSYAKKDRSLLNDLACLLASLGRIWRYTGSHYYVMVLVNELKPRRKETQAQQLANVTVSTSHRFAIYFLSSPIDLKMRQQRERDREREREKEREREGEGEREREKGKSATTLRCSSRSRKRFANRSADVRSHFRTLVYLTCFNGALNGTSEVEVELRVIAKRSTLKQFAVNQIALSFCWW